MSLQEMNIFQRLARQWETLHPYNAAQVLLLKGVPNVARIQLAWRKTVDDSGLGSVHVNRSSFRYETLNGELPHQLCPLISAGREIAEHLSFELNRPFEAESTNPFRPFILVRDAGSYYCGIVYQHWVADSVAIRMLLQGWFARVHDPDKARSEPFLHAPGGYWEVFGPGQANWKPVDAMLASMRWGGRIRYARRIESSAFADLRVRFTMAPTPAGLIDRLHRYARERKLTLNEVFLAAIAQACDRFVPAHHLNRRPDLALGNIVDLRPQNRRRLDQAFGLFLGFTSVVCRRGDLGDWDRLVHSIASQSRLQKATNSSAGSMLRMMAGLAASRVMGRDDLLNFYRKRTPLVGGISNVNLNRCWAGDYHPDPVLDYIRVSPTGPMLPVVFTTTTLGADLNVGLTYRPAIIPETSANPLLQTFIQRLASLV